MHKLHDVRRFCVVAYVWLLMGALAYGAYHLEDMNRSYWAELAGLSGADLIFVVIGSIVVTTALDGLEEALGHLKHPWLAWRLFSQNINFVPLRYWPLRLPFIALLMFNLPAMAWVEEIVFRGDLVIHPTSGWLDACWRSAAFGAVHVLAGVRVRTMLPLALAGLWLSWQYMAGGLDKAVLAHLVINTLGIVMLFVTWARTSRNPFTA